MKAIEGYEARLDLDLLALAFPVQAWRNNEGQKRRSGEDYNPPLRGGCQDPHRGSGSTP